MINEQFLNDLHEELITTSTTIREMEVQEIEMVADQKQERIQKNRRAARVFIDRAVQDVQNGMVNPLEVFIAFNDIMQKLTKAKECLGPLAYEQASLHGSKKFNLHGWDVTVCDGRKTYKFDNCAGIKDLEKQLKAEKDRLKKLKDAADVNGVATMTEINGKQVLCAPDQDGVLHALPDITYSKGYLTAKSTH